MCSQLSRRQERTQNILTTKGCYTAEPCLTKQDEKEEEQCPSTSEPKILVLQCLVTIHMSLSTTASVVLSLQPYKTDHHILRYDTHSSRPLNSEPSIK